MDRKVGSSRGASEGQAAGLTQQAPTAGTGWCILSAPHVLAEPPSLFASQAQSSKSWERMSDGLCQ